MKPSILINQNSGAKLILEQSHYSQIKIYKQILDNLNENGAKIPVMIYFDDPYEICKSNIYLETVYQLKSNYAKSYSYLEITNNKDELTQFIFNNLSNCQ